MRSYTHADTPFCSTPCGSASFARETYSCRARLNPHLHPSLVALLPIGSDRGFEQLARGLGTAAAFDAILLPAALVIVHEKRLQLIEKRFIHVAQVRRVLMAVGMNGHPQQTIV